MKNNMVSQGAASIPQPNQNFKWHANSTWTAAGISNNAETRDRTGDLQIFGLTLSQLSYRGRCVNKIENLYMETDGNS